MNYTTSIAFQMATTTELPSFNQTNGTNGLTTMPILTNPLLANGGANPPLEGLSSDEMALYDRQIRLWGAQAQQRIRSANILLISLRALGTEIAKSLTLAGVHSLTIVDDEHVTEDDIGGAQFFLRESDIGKPVSQANTRDSHISCD